jgi:putative membrane protein
MSPTAGTRRAAARSSLGLVAVMLAGACGRADTAADSARAADSAAAAAAAQPAPAPSTPATLTDPQIAHVAVTANAIDSAAGEMAKQKGSAAAVKEFAQTMVTDHGAVNKQAVALATKLNVTPEDNDVSRQLRSGADQSTATLQGLSGPAFDRAYIDNEVAYHQAVLDALDRTLIPGAQNAELKALLEQVRPNIAAHLERAKGIQGALPRQ